MLTQLSTVKARLALLPAETQYDDLLTNAIKAVSRRFDHETHRTLSRTENFTQEFDFDDTGITLACYPIEAVTKFELKTSETAGWQEQPAPNYLIRAGCILSLNLQLATCNLQLTLPSLARVTYTGGYVLPGTTAQPGQTALPEDLEQAAVEQVAFWFQNRDKLGVIRQWPIGGTYEQFADLDLLPNVGVTLAHYTRWSL